MDDLNDAATAKTAFEGVLFIQAVGLTKRSGRGIKRNERIMIGQVEELADTAGQKKTRSA